MIYLFHDAVEADHPGRNETLHALKRYYYWSAMDKEINEYVHSFLICVTVKTVRQPEVYSVNGYGSERRVHTNDL